MARARVRLLRIMAGVDTDTTARRCCRPAIRLAIWSRNRSSMNRKTVRQVVEEGVQEIVDALKAEFDEINAKFGEEHDRR